ncbi:MAG: ATP-binding cassette domain-containing protein, partial [Acidilobaceae archaeon]
TVSSSIGLNTELLYREVNVGFSGGERKRSEILQAIMLDPKIIILDEPDSGLDIDGIKKVADYIGDLKAKGKAVMLITHYARLLQYVMPDVVTVLIDGEVVARGDSKLALLVEEKGYNEVKKMYKG